MRPRRRFLRSRQRPALFPRRQALGLRTLIAVALFAATAAGKTVNVRATGAVGDGKADDAAAFRKPFEKRWEPLCENGAGVSVPFESSIFSGPAAKVTREKGKPGVLRTRGSTFRFILPHQAIERFEKQQRAWEKALRRGDQGSPGS